MGRSQHDLDVCNTDFLSGKHFAGEISVCIKDKSNLLFFEKYAALYFRWNIP